MELVLLISTHFVGQNCPSGLHRTKKHGLTGNVIFFQGEHETTKTKSSQLLLFLPQLPQSNQHLSFLDSPRTYCAEIVFFGL